MGGVTNDYMRVLEATERHLQALKAGGVRFLTVESETLRQLQEAPPPAAKKVQASPAPPIPSIVSAPVAEDVETAMAALRARACVCVKCPHLAGSGKNVVFGVGDIHAALMFVGEAPGADEDQQGEPFVGPAGQLLTRIITTIDRKS